MLCRTVCLHHGPFSGRGITEEQGKIFIGRIIPFIGQTDCDPKDIEKYQPQVVPQSDRSKWEKVKNSWQMATSFIQSVSSRGVASTVSDALGVDKTSGNRVSEEVYLQRRLSCFGDGRDVKKCPSLLETPMGSFCNSCGCKENTLARLDEVVAGSYTKLHYPKLDCPRKRSGFSNYEPAPTLSVIIPVLNDNAELNETIKSIRETSPPTVEIVVVDDFSEIPATISDPSAILLRNKSRLGAGASRDRGVKECSSDFLLLIDSHMRFR